MRPLQSWAVPGSYLISLICGHVSLNSYCLLLGSVTQRGLCSVLPDTVATYTCTYMHARECMYNAKVFPLLDLARKYLWRSRFRSALSCGEGHVWVREPPNASKGMCEDRRNLSSSPGDERERGRGCFYFQPPADQIPRRQGLFSPNDGDGKWFNPTQKSRGKPNLGKGFREGSTSSRPHLQSWGSGVPGNWDQARLLPALPMLPLEALQQDLSLLKGTVGFWVKG